MKRPSWFFAFSAGLAMSVTVLALSGCSGGKSVAPSNKADSSTRPTGSACIASLAYRDTGFNRIHDFGESDGCGVQTAVSLVATPTAIMSRPITVGCELAYELSRYESEVLQPLAQSLFGASITRIDTYGGYVCRGRTSNTARLSEHAKGKAVDLGAFILDNGESISVRKDWNDKGAKGRFLTEAAKGACSYFSVVLTPNSDKDHHDHFHLDIGPWKKCSP